LKKNRSGELNVRERAEWERYEYLEHLARMAKIAAAGIDYETAAPPVRSIRDELRRQGIRKTFAHQFKLMAERVDARIRAKRRPKKRDHGDGCAGNR
jgi:hypothetical protein